MIHALFETGGKRRGPLCILEFHQGVGFDLIRSCCSLNSIILLVTNLSVILEERLYTGFIMVVVHIR